MLKSILKKEDTLKDASPKKVVFSKKINYKTIPNRLDINNVPVSETFPESKINIKSNIYDFKSNETVTTDQKCIIIDYSYMIVFIVVMLILLLCNMCCNKDPVVVELT